VDAPRRSTVAVVIRRGPSPDAPVLVRQLPDGTWELPQVEVSTLRSSARRQAAESIIISAVARWRDAKAAIASMQWSVGLVAGHKAAVAAVVCDGPMRELKGARWSWIDSVAAPAMPSLSQAVAQGVQRALGPPRQENRGTTRKARTGELPRHVRWSQASSYVAATLQSEDDAPAVAAADIEATLNTLVSESSSSERPAAQQVDQLFMEKILQRAKQRARSRGSRAVEPRDVAEAADEARGRSVDSPAVVKPAHWNELLSEPARIRCVVMALKETGRPAPRVDGTTGATRAGGWRTQWCGGYHVPTSGSRRGHLRFGADGDPSHSSLSR